MDKRCQADSPARIGSGLRFDLNDPGSLPTRMTNDIMKVVRLTEFCKKLHLTVV